MQRAEADIGVVYKRSILISTKGRSNSHHLTKARVSLRLWEHEDAGLYTGIITCQMAQRRQVAPPQAQKMSA